MSELDKDKEDVINKLIPEKELIDGDLSSMRTELENCYGVLSALMDRINDLELTMQLREHCRSCTKKRDESWVTTCACSISWLYTLRQIFVKISNDFSNKEETIDPRLFKFVIASRKEVYKLFDKVESMEIPLQEERKEASSEFSLQRIAEKLNDFYERFWDVFRIYKRIKEEEDCKGCYKDKGIIDCCSRTSSTLNIMHWFFKRLIHYYEKFLDQPIDPKLMTLLKESATKFDDLYKEISE